MQRNTALVSTYLSGVYTFTLKPTELKPTLKIRNYTKDAYNRVKKREEKQAEKDRSRYKSRKEVLTECRQHWHSIEALQRSLMESSSAGSEGVRDSLQRFSADNVRLTDGHTVSPPCHDELQHALDRALSEDEQMLSSSDIRIRDNSPARSVAVLRNIPAFEDGLSMYSTTAVHEVDSAVDKQTTKHISARDHHTRLCDQENAPYQEASDPVFAPASASGAIDNAGATRSESFSCEHDMVDVDVETVHVASNRRIKKKSKPRSLCPPTRIRIKAVKPPAQKRHIVQNALTACSHQLQDPKETREDRKLPASASGRLRFRPKRSFADGYA